MGKNIARDPEMNLPVAETTGNALVHSTKNPQKMHWLREWRSLGWSSNLCLFLSAGYTARIYCDKVE